MTGTALGPAIGTLAGGTLIAIFGWRPVFIALGLLTLGWLLPWTMSMPRSQLSHAVGRASAPRAVDILRHRSFWGGAIGHFCVNYLAYFVLTWMPFYLVREKRFTLPTMGKLAALFYVVEASFTIVTGAVTDRSIRAGHSPTVARKTAMFIGHTLAAAALACWTVAGPRWFFLCVFVTFAAWGIAATGIFAFPQALAGPEASGKWTGLQNCFANTAGIIAPAMTGFLLDWTGSFTLTLAAAATVMFIGGLAWVVIVGPLDQVTFTKTAIAKTSVET